MKCSLQATFHWRNNFKIKRTKAFIHKNNSKAYLIFWKTTFLLLVSLALSPFSPPHRCRSSREPPPDTHATYLSLSIGKLLNGHSRFPSPGSVQWGRGQGSRERWRLVLSRLSESPGSRPALLWWELSEGTCYHGSSWRCLCWERRGIIGVGEREQVCCVLYSLNYGSSKCSGLFSTNALATAAGHMNSVCALIYENKGTRTYKVSSDFFKWGCMKALSVVRVSLYNKWRSAHP